MTELLGGETTGAREPAEAIAGRKKPLTLAGLDGMRGGGCGFEGCVIDWTGGAGTGGPAATATVGSTRGVSDCGGAIAVAGWLGAGDRAGFETSEGDVDEPTFFARAASASPSSWGRRELDLGAEAGADGAAAAAETASLRGAIPARSGTGRAVVIRFGSAGVPIQNL